MQSNVSNEDKEQQTKVTNEPNFVLDRLVKEKYKSKAAFAEELGITRQMLYKVINGTKEPSIALKIRIAKHLGVDSLTLWRPKENERF